MYTNLSKEKKERLIKYIDNKFFDDILGENNKRRNQC